LLADLRWNRAGEGEQNESIIISVKGHLHLKELVDETREAGKYVFWKDEIRYRGDFKNTEDFSNKCGLSFQKMEDSGYT
jgi:hypothetical protein